MSKPEGIIVVAGPTASGKSELAIKLAQSFKGELICSDSMQVYRKLDVGTSKPSYKDQELIPHHQIDLIDPNENYSAGKYEKDTAKIIKKIHSRGHIPILVGGTGLYFRALIYGISKIPEIPKLIKKKVYTLHLNNGTQYCWQILQKKDPQSAEKIHQNDTARILRSLEVCLATGSSITQFQKKQPFKKARYPFLAFALEWERNILYERINQRTQKMLDSGWIEEVKELLKYYPKNSKPFQSIGYREIVQYITGELEFDKMVKIIQQRTRRYAKRQITWFKNDSMIEWYHPNEVTQIINRIKVFLEK